jgi:F0F1-type ATP synthase assembly protein I
VGIDSPDLPPNQRPNRPSDPSQRKQSEPVSRQFAIALELPFVLVSAIVVGGVFGYLLDRWWHTKPVFTLILGGVGFYAGVRDVLRRVSGSGNGSS